MALRTRHTWNRIAKRDLVQDMGETYKLFFFFFLIEDSRSNLRRHRQNYFKFMHELNRRFFYWNTSAAVNVFVDADYMHFENI